MLWLLDVFFLVALIVADVWIFGCETGSFADPPCTHACTGFCVHYPSKPGFNFIWLSVNPEEWLVQLLRLDVNNSLGFVHFYPLTPGEETSLLLWWLTSSPHGNSSKATFEVLHIIHTHTHTHSHLTAVLRPKLLACDPCLVLWKPFVVYWNSILLNFCSNRFIVAARWCDMVCTTPGNLLDFEIAQWKYWISPEISLFLDILAARLMERQDNWS